MECTGFSHSYPPFAVEVPLCFNVFETELFVPFVVIIMYSIKNQQMKYAHNPTLQRERGALKRGAV